MRWFRWWKTTPQKIVPEVCAFCDAQGSQAALVRLEDSRHYPLKLCCAGCRETFAEFEGAVRHEPRPGRRPWLLADPGTERPVVAGPDPMVAARAALGGLRKRLRLVPVTTARIAPYRFGLYGAITFDAASRAEAFDSIVQAVAGRLSSHSDGGVGYMALSVGLFAGSRGVLLQEITTDGHRYEQTCYLVDTDFEFCRYVAYDH